MKEYQTVANDFNTCFDCKYRDIQETGHEWIECHCQLTNNWCPPYRGCENWESEEESR